MYLVIEGPNGSGKSTVVKMLAEILNKTVPTTTVREPGGTALGELFRAIAMLDLKDNNAVTDFFLMMASRAELSQKIIEPDRGKKIIISDRSIVSSAVYQFILKNNYGIDVLDDMVRTFAISVPEVTYFLDCEPEILIERLGKRLEKDVDKFSKLPRIRDEVEAYKYVATKKLGAARHSVVIDASPVPEKVALSIINDLSDRGLI